MVIVDQISKKYGKQGVLAGVSLTAGPGERVGIVGRNGCGKSTLIKILTGLEKPDSGSLTYFGQNPLADRRVFSTMCGYVPQSNPLMEELSVLDNLKLFGAGADMVRDPLIAPFELEPILKKPVEKLSGGMKRRVAIACAVCHMPPILFMDEPTTALDLFYKETIHNWMDQYRQSGGILIMVTHDQKEIESCDRVVEIDKASNVF